MTDENTNTHSDDDDREESDADLTQRLKEYALALYAWLRAQVTQSVEEIAPQLRGAVAGVSIPRRAIKPLAVAGVLLVSAIVLGPAAPLGDEPAVETEEPVSGETYEAEDAPTLNGATLNTLPSSFTGASADAPAPPEQVRASAGSQTMNVETAVVDGEPAIVLEDDRTHDGRWVSIETAWLEETVGEIPSAAYIDHEEDGEYAAPLNVRGDSAAFYVRGFSTNTVTFDGEVTLSGSQAADGTQYEYDLENTSGVEDPSIDLTGVENSEWKNVSGSGVVGSSRSVDVGGNADPTGPGGSPSLTVSSPDGDTTQYSGIDTSVDVMGSDSNGNPINSEVAILGVDSQFDVIDLNVQADFTSGDEYVDIYIVEEMPDQNYGEGTLVKENYRVSDGSPITLNETYNPSGSTITVEFVTVEAPGSYDRVQIKADKSASSVGITTSSGGGGTYDAYPGLELRTTPPTDLTATIGSETVSFGDFSNGDQKTENIALGTGSTSLNWTGANGGFDYKLEKKERTTTVDPVVELNGETVGVDGTLADGETTSLDANASWLQEGTNRVNISTNSPSSGPASLVGFEYSHGAETTTSATVDETTWSQTTTVSNTWASARSNATASIPMNDRVVDVRNVEVRYNGTTWESVAGSDYALNGTDLTVQLGDVAAGSTTEVRATGSKIRVKDGAITVLDPTTSSDTLDTRVQVDDAGPDFALSVDSTVFGERVHYAENATWGETTGDTTITADGGQTLTLPNATVGAETTVRTWPIEVAVAQDRMTVGELAGDRSEPGLAVEGDGLAEVDYTFVDAADATPYILWSETNEIVRAEGLASSPITLTDDNSEETLIFQVDDGSASGSGSGSDSATDGGGGPMATAGGGFAALQALIPDGQTLLIGVGLLGGLFVVGRRTGVVTEDRTEVATSAASSAANTVGGLVERVLANEIVFGVLILAGTGWVLTSGVLPEQTTLIVALGAVPVALFLVLQQFDAFDFRIWVGSTALVAVLGIQALAPQLGETIAEEAGVIIVVGVIALGWRALSAWRAEASTPDNVTNLEVETTEDNDNA